MGNGAPADVRGHVSCGKAPSHPRFCASPLFPAPCGSERGAWASGMPFSSPEQQTLTLVCIMYRGKESEGRGRDQRGLVRLRGEWVVRGYCTQGKEKGQPPTRHDLVHLQSLLQPRQASLRYLWVHMDRGRRVRRLWRPVVRRGSPAPVRSPRTCLQEKNVWGKGSAAAEDGDWCCPGCPPRLTTHSPRIQMYVSP
jgi:hypothetical protein